MSTPLYTVGVLGIEGLRVRFAVVPTMDRGENALPSGYNRTFFFALLWEWAQKSSQTPCGVAAVVTAEQICNEQFLGLWARKFVRSVKRTLLQELPPDENYPQEDGKNFYRGVYEIEVTNAQWIVDDTPKFAWETTAYECTEHQASWVLEVERSETMPVLQARAMLEQRGHDPGLLESFLSEETQTELVLQVDPFDQHEHKLVADGLWCGQVLRECWLQSMASERGAQVEFPWGKERDYLFNGAGAPPLQQQLCTCSVEALPGNQYRVHLTARSSWIPRDLSVGKSWESSAIPSARWAFSGGDSVAATGMIPPALCEIEIEEPTMLSIEAGESEFSQMECSPEGKLIGVVRENGTLEVFESATGKKLFTEEGDGEDCARVIAFSENLLVWGNSMSSLRALDLRTKQSGPELPSESYLVGTVGNRFVFQRKDTLFFWDEKGGERKPFYRTRTNSSYVRMSTAAKVPLVVFGFTHWNSAGDRVRALKAMLWKPGKGVQRTWRMAASSQSELLACVLDPEGKWVGIATDVSPGVRRWDVATGSELEPLDHEARLLHLSVSPDGRYVVGAAGNEGVLWRVGASAPLRRFRLPRASVWCARWLPRNDEHQGAFALMGANELGIWEVRLP